MLSPSGGSNPPLPARPGLWCGRVSGMTVRPGALARPTRLSLGDGMEEHHADRCRTSRCEGSAALAHVAETRRGLRPARRHRPAHRAPAYAIRWMDTPACRLSRGLCSAVRRVLTLP